MLTPLAPNSDAQQVFGRLLEDRAPRHKDTCLITMVIVGTSPKDRVVGPLPNGRTSWLINGDDPNYLLTGMILLATW